MRTPEDPEHDIQDQTALFQRVVTLLEAKRAADPTIMEVARLPFAVLWGRKDYVLYFQQGAKRKIPFGQIICRGDSPSRFQELSIVRSKKSAFRFQLNHGPDRKLEVIAIDIVESFLRQTE